MRHAVHCLIDRQYNFISHESSQPHLIHRRYWATDDLYSNRTVRDVNSRARRSHPDFSEPVTKGWQSGLKTRTMKGVNPEHWGCETQDLTVDIKLCTSMISVGGCYEPLFTWMWRDAGCVSNRTEYIYVWSGLSFHIRTLKWIPKNCPFIFGNLWCLIVVSCLEVTDFTVFGAGFWE